MNASFSMTIQVPCVFSPTGKHPIDIAWFREGCEKEKPLIVKQLNCACDSRDGAAESAGRLGGMTCVEMVNLIRARIKMRTAWAYGDETQQNKDARKGSELIAATGFARLDELLVQGPNRIEARKLRAKEEEEAAKTLSYDLLAQRVAERAVVAVGKGFSRKLGDVLDVVVTTTDGERHLKISNITVARKDIGETYWAINELTILNRSMGTRAIQGNCLLCMKKDSHSHDGSKGHRENLVLATRAAVRALTFKKSVTVLSKHGR